MLSMLGGIVGDDAVQRAMSEYAKAWAFKHPSPWDYIFFMNNALKQDLDWFWDYWLWTTESVNGAIESVTATGGATTVTVRQDGQMPSPVVLQGAVRADGRRDQADEQREDGGRHDGDRHLAGRRVVQRQPHVRRRPRFRRPRDQKITLDPGCRFPIGSRGQRLAETRGRDRATVGRQLVRRLVGGDPGRPTLSEARSADTDGSGTAGRDNRATPATIASRINAVTMVSG